MQREASPVLARFLFTELRKHLTLFHCVRVRHAAAVCSGFSVSAGPRAVRRRQCRSSRVHLGRRFHRRCQTQIVRQVQALPGRGSRQGDMSRFLHPLDLDLPRNHGTCPKCDKIASVSSLLFNDMSRDKTKRTTRSVAKSGTCRASTLFLLHISSG